VTRFDHFFILYTGLVIGIICFVFPLIISVFDYLEKKRIEEELRINTEKENNLAQAIEKISAPETKQEEKEKQIHASSKDLRKERTKKLFNQFYYNPQFRLWIILIPLLITLGMCIFDIFTSEKCHLTYFSLIPFVLAMFFLIDTLIRVIKLIKASILK
jgi:ABC-type multidrug transport system fused ATPase/permease subunit